MKTTEYTITQTILQSDDAVIYRAFCNLDQRAVILKIIESKFDILVKIDHLKREYDVLKKVDNKNILKPTAFEMYHGKATLVMEDFNGVPLSNLLGVPMEIEDFLNYAVLIAEAVSEIHRHNIIHKNLKPQNILIDTSTNTVKITGFGLATRLPREQQTGGPSKLMEGSLPYMSPEQTGRMNRAIDNRSDLYSLGVTFHQMLTGKLPFEAKDPLEWVHSHVARTPQLVNQVVPKTPEIIVRIVSKLLAKMADDRYQTASGLQNDLELCLKEWRTYKYIDLFPLGERDISNRFLIPQKLYGRDLEIADLFANFKSVVVTGIPRIALISGYSGIGKSALVNELHKPIVQEHGFFISGKFDQYKRDISFSTIVQSFRELVLTILVESEDKIAEWKKKIELSLGDNAQLVVDVIPQIELLIGKQKPVSELPLFEAQNRFRTVFQSFIMVFSQKEHPLTLFLDDLQWADSASLALMSDLVTHPDTSYLFIIGAYRDNEVNPAHPLIHVLNNIKKSGIHVSDIILTPLSIEDLILFIADILRSKTLEVEALAKLVYHKTVGNPFFAIQFLTSMYEEDLIKFNEDTRAWQWDTEKIFTKSFTDNVIDLVIRKIKRLPAGTQKALQQLACLGNTVEIRILTMVLNCSEEELQTDLWEALNNGVIIHTNNAYKFVHDRLFEAAYSLIPEENRAAEHLRIARILITSFTQKEIEERLFDIVNHLNFAIEIVTDSEDEIIATKLNLLAAQRARNATAFKSAINYCDFGQRFLGLHAWNAENESDFILSFTLTLARAECELANSNFEETEIQIDLLLSNARTRSEQSAAQKIQIELYTAKGLSAEALSDAIDCMRLYGIDLVPHPGLVKTKAFNLALERRIKKIGLDSLVKLPLMKDKDIEAAMGILAGMLPNAYFTDVHLHRMIACYMIDLTLSYGVCALSPMGLAAYGFELCVLARYLEASHYGHIAEELINHHGFVSVRAKVFNLLGACIVPWSNSFSEAINYLRQGIAAEGGDIIFSCLCSIYTVILSFESGERLDVVDRTADQVIKYITTRRYDPIADGAHLVQRLTRCLQGRTDGVTSFSDAIFDEALFVEKLKHHPLKLMETWYHLFKLQAAIFFGDLPLALSCAKSTEPLVFLLRGQQTEIEFTYFAALAIAGMWDDLTAEDHKAWKPILKKYIQRLDNWAENNPASFQNRASLIAAEIARIEKRNVDAGRLYLEAITSARENGFVQNEALSYERASYFYKILGFDLFAETYLREAITCYSSWGADGKVRQLEHLYPKLREKENQLSSTTLVVRPEQLDLLAGIKASQAISSEIVLDKLILTLLDVVLEQSGAQKAQLILSHDSVLGIEARAKIEESGIKSEILNAELVDTSRNVPISLIRYVQRTKDRIIFDDTAPDAAKFSADEYIVRTKPKSILCLPILRGSELTGILYLENSIIPGVFSTERLSVLELLASQAAISLQNAQFYKSLKEENTQRKLTQEALRSSQEQLQAIIDSSSAIIYMKDKAGKYILINRRFEILFNIKKEWAVGKTDYDIFPKEVAEEIRFNDKKALETNETLEKEEVVPQADGLHTYISIKFPLLNSNGISYAICGISTDITDRKRIESEREQLLLQEQHALTVAQKSIEARDDFISIASHELRTPLTPLKIYLDMLKKALKDIPPDVLPKINILKIALDKTDGSLERLTKLTKELLDVSRITSGRMVLNFEKINLSKLLQEVIERYDLELKNAKSELSIEISAEVIGHWDRNRIEQVIDNLLSNSIKYGLGKLIEITLRKESKKAILIIRDHGIGINKEEQEKIFERFVRATSIKHYEGLGLGLYISNEIIKAHGGNISVESELGFGAAFTVELPLEF